MLRGHERECLGAQVDVAIHRAQNVAAFGPRDGHGRPGIGERGQPDPQIRPLRLQPELHPAQHVGSAAGGGGDIKPVRPQSRHHAVIHHHPVLAQHDAIRAAAWGHAAHVMGVQALEETFCVRPRNIDLAQRGSIHDAGGCARGHTFAAHGRFHVFTIQRIVMRSQPLPDDLEGRVPLDMPVMQRRLALRFVQIAHIAACTGTETHRREGRPEGGGADFGNRLAQSFGHQGHAVDVAHLALVRAKAQGGVALDVLDMFKAFTQRQFHIGQRGVILIVDELFTAAGLDGICRHPPQRHQRPGILVGR